MSVSVGGSVFANGRVYGTFINVRIQNCLNSVPIVDYVSENEKYRVLFLATGYVMNENKWDENPNPRLIV